MNTEFIIVTTYGKFPLPRGTDISIRNYRLVPWQDAESGEDGSFTVGDIVFTTDSRIYTLVGMTSPYEFYWEHLECLEPYLCREDDEDEAFCLWDAEEPEIYIDVFDPEYHFEELRMEDRPAMDRILANKIRCLTCGQIIQSVSVHDFVRCRCGACAVDGGSQYLKRVCNSEDCYEELSVIRMA